MTPRKSAAAGGHIVLWFFPKAGSTGCTQEACAFKAAMPKLKTAGAMVVGISPDSPRKLANFRKKHRLPYTLLSDGDALVAKELGLWVPKVLFGHRYFGVERVTYILDAKGNVAKEISGVTPKDHAAEVLKFLASR